MARKKWAAQQDITPLLLKVREKKKWQITLRRYVLERNKCVQYAPYFGLDIENMRKWFEMQFEKDMGWDEFGKSWQFDHLLPVSCFDFSNDGDLKLCWNFINLRVNPLPSDQMPLSKTDLLTAKNFFTALYNQTNYPLCLQYLEKINRLEAAFLPTSAKQQNFILENRAYLDVIDHYSAFEFELLNSGRTTADVMKEVNFLKKF